MAQRLEMIALTEDILGSRERMSGRGTLPGWLVFRPPNHYPKPEVDAMSRLNWQRRWDPGRDLQREMGRLFETVEPLHSWRLTRQFPAINLYDAGDRYVLS